MHNPVISNAIDRILAIVILLTLLAGGYLLVRYVYLEQLTSLSHELEVLKKKHAKIDSILVSEKELKKQIRELKVRTQKNKLFLNNKNSATAASELQNYIKRLVGTYSKAKISSIKPYPVKTYDDYSETSLEISLLEISHDDLHRLLYNIENNAPVVLVREIEIKLARRKYRPLVKSEVEPTRMGASMVVSSFFREVAG